MIRVVSKDQLFTKVSFVYVIGYFMLTAPATERLGIESFYFSILFFFPSLYIIIALNIKRSILPGICLIMLVSFLISAFSNVVFYSHYFNVVGFMSSFINVLINMVISFSFYVLLSNKFTNCEKVIDGLLIFSMAYALVKYSMLRVGIFSPELGDYYRMHDKFPFILRGFFNEPSSYTSFISILLLLKLFVVRHYINMSLIFFLSMVTFTLSLSFSAWVLIVLIWSLYLLKHNFRIFLGLLVVGFMGFAVVGLDDVERIRLMLERVDRILSGDDGSASYRIFQTWAFVPYLTSPSHLIFGVGLGNMGEFSIKVMGYESEFVGVNIFANSLMLGGLVFTFLLLTVIYSTFSVSYLALFCYLLICFLHGYIIGPYLFPMIFIALACTKNRLCLNSRINSVQKVGPFRLNS